ncbi:MAG: phosphoribosylformylglycinamidine synthase subunit PurQ [Myxococcales bacterium]|nr:phosphoribosylformylglycinamidine synthase subunit PurQ [Myxococcales bacterium]
MSESRPSPSRRRVLVLWGDGINCESALARAFAQAGAPVELEHVNDFLRRADLGPFGVLAFPGGFSFGDELRSGRILAEKLRTALGERLADFHARGGLTLGICNGFQVLVRLGIFGADVSLARNAGPETGPDFIDRWVEVEVSPAARQSPWLRHGPDRVWMPIRHGEGRLVAESATSAFRQPALRYRSDPNGSLDRVAGLLDRSGQVFGLMPHPEAATHAFLHPLGVPEPEANAAALLGWFDSATRLDGPDEVSPGGHS